MKQLIALALGFGLAAVGGAATDGAADTATANPQIVMETTKGTIVLELDPAKAPKTVENFLSYVESGHFDGTIFHRIIPKFMAQGGGFTADMKQKPVEAPVENEADNGLKNLRGTVAMARTSDPHSATAQFFINSIDNDFLNHTSKTPRGWGYTVFGRVIQGMDVVDAMSSVQTTRRGGHGDVPVEPIAITSAKVKK